MKVDLDAPINDLEGKQLVMAGDRKVTVALACTEALLGTYRDEDNLDGKTKYARYGLVRRIAKGGVQNFNSEDIVTIKALVAKAWGPLVLGQVWDLLEGTPPVPLKAVAKE